MCDVGFTKGGEMYSGLECDIRKKEKEELQVSIQRRIYISFQNRSSRGRTVVLIISLPDPVIRVSLSGGSQGLTSCSSLVLVVRHTFVAWRTASSIKLLVSTT